MNAANIIASATGVLLDFDGPVCSIFANLSASSVAEDLRLVLITDGIDIDAEIANELDPMEVLRYAARLSPDVLAHVDDALRAAELEAATTAEPTPSAAAFIRHINDRGIPLVIVSNNSTAAILRYLDNHQLTPCVRSVVGRSFARPDLMKPHPWPLIRGIEIIGSRGSGCVIIGDSVADMAAARSAGVPSIGYANRPDKLLALSDAGARAIVTDMAQLLEHPQRTRR